MKQSETDEHSKKTRKELHLTNNTICILNLGNWLMNFRSNWKCGFKNDDIFSNDCSYYFNESNNFKC